MLSLINFLSESLTSDDSLNSALIQISDFVKNYVLVVIYVALGLFLVVKGAMLGVQIVKSADEPQVRQEKINSLKWLIIGIAIAYGVAGATDIILSVFRNSIGGNAE